MVQFAARAAMILGTPGQRHVGGAQVATVSIIGLTFLWCLRQAFTFASLRLSASFAPYDDEGYVLLSVREFLARGALYDEVYTNYGPTYYAYRHLLSIIQGVPTHDLTRLTTLYTWMCAAVFLGLGALWLTRSGLAAVAVFCATTITLIPLANEPGHPQELLVALTALSIAVAASPLRLRLRVTLLASISALACLTKVNVGAFIGLATLVTVLPLAPGVSRVAAALIFGLVPAVLMSRHVGQWAWPYALGCGAGVAAAVVMRPDSELRLTSFRNGAAMLAGLLLPTVLLLIYLVAQGTTWTALLNGIVVRPLQFGGLYVNPFQAPLGAVAASLVAAGIAMYASHHVAAMPRQLQHLISVFKVLVGLYVTLWMRNPAEIIGGSGVVIVALLLSFHPSGSSQSFGRAFLALSAALHTGTAYPVAGSQVAWSSFLLFMASYVGLWDGLGELRAAVADFPASSRVGAIGFFCLGLAVYYSSRTPVAALEAGLQNQRSLPFEGATSIRLPHAQAATYTWLTQNVKGHCSDFVTLPGYGSLYPWSGMRPPTGHNVTAWTFLLNEQEQKKIVDQMRAASRPCAVYNPAGQAGWTSGAVAAAGQGEKVAARPLVDYIMGLTPVASYAGYEFRTPQDLVSTWRFDYLLSGSRSFTGAETFPVPADAAAAAPSLRLWFKSEGQGGTIVGVQSTTSPQTPSRCFLYHEPKKSRMTSSALQESRATTTSRISPLNGNQESFPAGQPAVNPVPSCITVAHFSGLAGPVSPTNSPSTYNCCRSGPLTITT